MCCCYCSFHSLLLSPLCFTFRFARAGTRIRALVFACCRGHSCLRLSYGGFIVSALSSLRVPVSLRVPAVSLLARYVSLLVRYVSLLVRHVSLLVPAVSLLVSSVSGALSNPSQYQDEDLSVRLEQLHALHFLLFASLSHSWYSTLGQPTFRI
jgi:hypothetical protein